MIKLFKILRQPNLSCNGGNLKWGLPKQKKDGTWIPGKWHSVKGALLLCKNGIHLAQRSAVMDWLQTPFMRQEITCVYEAEMYVESGKGYFFIKGNQKFCCRKVRLLKPFTGKIRNKRGSDERYAYFRDGLIHRAKGPAYKRYLMEPHHYLNGKFYQTLGELKQALEAS